MAPDEHGSRPAGIVHRHSARATAARTPVRSDSRAHVVERARPATRPEGGDRDGRLDDHARHDHTHYSLSLLQQGLAMDDEGLHNRIKVQRAMRDLTQADLAAMAGVTRKSVNAVET